MTASSWPTPPARSRPSRWGGSSKGPGVVPCVAGEHALDVGDDRRVVGYDHRRVPGHDLAVGGDEELLDVPADVAVVAVHVSRLGQLGVQRMAVGPVDVDLLEHGEAHAVVEGAELL